MPFVEATREYYRPSWFHLVVADELDRWWQTDGARTILCLPPQHGKTELASRALPAWILGVAPDTRIICSTYSDENAQKYNLEVQRTIDSPAYAAIFPATRLAQAAVGDRRMGSERNRARRTAHYFEIVGRRGFVRSAGIGAGIGGLPADVLIIDDPVKDRRDAESSTVRENVWSWYTSVARRRLKPPGKVLVIATRWHEDDLIGKLLVTAQADRAADQWRVVRFPAFAETVDDYPRHELDERPEGAPLWPERFGVSDLESARAEMTGYEWDGLYQQRPSRPGGLVFKVQRIQVIDAAPALPPNARRCRFWDVAATEDDPRACWTVGVLISRTKEGLIVIEDVQRGQWSPSDVDLKIIQTAQTDGKRVAVREEQEPGSSGKSVVAVRATKLAGWDYKGVPSDRAKELRWLPLAAQIEAGNVAVVNREWTHVFLDELARAGPGAKLKDQADAAAGAFLAITLDPQPLRSATWG